MFRNFEKISHDEVIKWHGKVTKELKDILLRLL